MSRKKWNVGVSNEFLFFICSFRISLLLLFARSNTIYSAYAITKVYI